MPDQEKRRTTVWLGAEDRQAIRRIRQRWQLETDSAAIRFALRVVAASERLEVVLPERLLKEVDDD